MAHLGYSRIEDHNKYQETDHLYDPLRTVLLRPEVVESHRQYLNPAAQHSRVTHDYALITRDEAQTLHDHTYIPVDKRLVATRNLDKVRNNRFMVVDAQEKVVGAPITVEEMNRIRGQGLKEEKIVWDFGNEPQPEPEPIRVSEPLRTSYRSPPIEEYKKKESYKYNLYNMIDEPMNRIREFGCSACTCPGNEIIASRNNPQSLHWLK